MTRGKDSETTARAQRRAATRAALIQRPMRSPHEPSDPLDPAQVAAVVGVSRPLFYAHFRTRADFVDALLSSIHEDARPAADPSPGTGADAILAFFAGLAGPLDRHAALARRIVPASHQPGPVAEVRARRRERAIARVSALLPDGTPDREARAAFLMDAFLGLQLAWSKASEGSLGERVRRDLAWAVRGVSRPPRESRNTMPVAPTLRFAPDRTVASIVTESPRTARVFERFGIDYCCGGRVRLADACATKGLSPDDVGAELSAAVAGRGPRARLVARPPPSQ